MTEKWPISHRIFFKIKKKTKSNLERNSTRKWRQFGQISHGSFNSVFFSTFKGLFSQHFTIGAITELWSDSTSTAGWVPAWRCGIERIIWGLMQHMSLSYTEWLQYHIGNFKSAALSSTGTRWRKMAIQRCVSNPALPLSVDAWQSWLKACQLLDYATLGMPSTEVGDHSGIARDARLSELQ